MKQFYICQAGTGSYTLCSFDKPVRKLLVTSARSCWLAIPFSDESISKNFYIPGNQVVEIDFQTANSGNGCTGVELKATGDTGGNVYISVSEYGTVGNNDWYK